ncbi:MAG: DUF1175 domain-containing protein [Acidobacteriota bacterium]|nr:DUF1175 domain-containing protein [Acidobacteriota bacterium]
MTSLRHRARATAGGLLLALVATSAPAQVRLADESDRAAFRAWFVLLADSQFERAAADVTDCAALVRFAFREALRAHTPEWSRQVALPFAPHFPDVQSPPPVTTSGWPLFRVSDRPDQYGEFADARTLITRNSVPLGRDATRARPGDLLYFQQPGQSEPDHLMVVVGRSSFEDDGTDWVVYHTGPSSEGPGEVRKTRLATLTRHPAPRWRPIAANPRFVGVFRLVALSSR